MYYYSLEKYYKKPDQPNLGTPKENFKKTIVSPLDDILVDPDLNGSKQKKDKAFTSQTTLNKDLFKRIRVMNSDVSEALENIFSYQFTMNGFTLTVLKMFEKLLDNTTKPNTTGSDKQTKPLSPEAHFASKSSKSPLGIELGAVMQNVQKMQDELFNLVNEVIPQKEKTSFKNKGSRTPNSELRTSSPFNRGLDTPVTIESRANRCQTPTQRSSKLRKPKMKLNLQKLYEQDQKENNVAPTSNTNLSSRFMSNSSPLKLGTSMSLVCTRNKQNIDYSNLAKKDKSISNGGYDLNLNVLSDLKNDPKRNFSEKIHARVERDVIPKKELKEDETSFQSCACVTNEDVPILMPQRVPSEKSLSRLQAGVQREDPVEIIKKERNIIKHLMGIQAATLQKNNNASSYNKRYLIDVKWWIAWKEYVNLDATDLDENKLLRPSYPRPGMIVNSDLLNQEHLDQDNIEPSQIDLKDNILEHHDFIAVSREIFKILANWYGCDYEIMRMMKPDPSHPDKFYLDLFPKKRTLKK